MSDKQNRRLSRRGWLRAGLLFLAASGLGAGLWPLPFPRAFYEDFPLPGRDWVSTLGPYNEHLIRDYGGLNLALGVLFLFAALFPERRLVQASLVAWIFYAVPHFAFHATQMRHFSPGDNLAQLISLGFLVLFPLALLFVSEQFARQSFGVQTSTSGDGTAPNRGVLRQEKTPMQRTKPRPTSSQRLP
jgi:hypothetical protein